MMMERSRVSTHKLSHAYEPYEIMSKIRISFWAFLIAFGLFAISGITNTASAENVSVTVDSGFQQREGADVTIKDSSGKVVKTGTTAKEGGTGRPKFETDLPTGTYTIETSWVNARGRTETGTKTFTVTNGKNEPNVVVAEGGNQNPPGQGTSATAAFDTGRTGKLRTPGDKSHLFGLALYGGRSWAGHDDASIQSSTLGTVANDSLDNNQNVIGAEARLYMNERQQQMFRLGVGLYLWGTYLHYTGGDNSNIFAEFHAPTAGLDSGVNLRMLSTFGFGLGWRTNIFQRVGLALAFGAHATRVETSALSNETGGGGNDEVLTTRDTSFGPMGSVEISTPIYQNSVEVEAFGRADAMHLGSVMTTGMSTLNNRYTAEVDGGFQGLFQFGVRVNF